MFQNAPNGADGREGGSGYQYINQQGGRPDPGTGYMPPPTAGGVQTPVQGKQEAGYKHLFSQAGKGEGGQGGLYKRLFQRKAAPQQEGGDQQAPAQQAQVYTGMQQRVPQSTGYQAMNQQPAGYAGMQSPAQPAGYQAMNQQPAGYAGMQSPAQPAGYQAMNQQPAGYAGMQSPAQPTGYQAMNQQAAGYAGMQPPAQPTGYQAMNQQPAGYAGMQPTAQPTGYQAMGQQPTGYAAMQPPTQNTAYQQPMNPAPAASQPETEPAGTGFQTEGGQDGGAGTPPPREKGRWGRILQIAAVAAAAVALVVYLVVALVPPRANFATIQAGMLGARYGGDALIVRNETPFVAEGVTSIQYVAEEGKLCLRSMPICNVYSSGYSTKEITTLQDYRNQIRDYQLSLLNAETTYDAKLARVESDVLSRAIEVRSILAGTKGNLGNQEKLLATAITARQQYLKTKYANDQRMSRLYDDERAQQQRINSWTKQYAATSDAIVSFYSDGFEYGLTTANFEQFTPAEVRRMIRGEKPAGSETAAKGRTTIYRTIRDGSWNVLFLVRDQNWNPVEGQQYELLLENFRNTTVQAKVLSFTRSGGELLVRLSVENDVTPVLYMRSCSAELGDYVSTLMVPSRAIYTQDEMKGVVIVEGSSQAFVPIKVVYQDGDNMYITSITPGLLYEGQTIRLF